jgi:cysteine protease ATG4
MNTQVVSRERSIFLSKLNFPSSSSDHRLQDEGNSDVEGKVKNRLLSMWNNVKYGMKLKTNFSKESPVWLLGKCYRRIESPSSDSTELGTDVAAFQSQSEVIRAEILTR